jgi:hypothetical protein
LIPCHLVFAVVAMARSTTTHKSSLGSSSANRLVLTFALILVLFVTALWNILANPGATVH